MSTHPSSVPDFDDLPKVKDMPQGCAWGIFDCDGKKDVLGTLNFLTPDIVKDASKEVQDGVSISLNWPLNAMSKIPVPGRPPPEHKLLYLPESMTPGVVNGTHFVTTSISQVDWLTTDLSPAVNQCLPKLQVTTTHPLLTTGTSEEGLVARGVLLDYKAYTEDKGINFHAFDGTRIKVADLEACAAHQGLELKQGDVLIIRLGGTEIIETLTSDQVMQMLGAYKLSGVDGSEETARWIWNKRFAAVAGDSNAFEAFPPLRPDGSEGGMNELVLHQYLLSCFGMSIGELWDLSRLSRYCREKKRYSFMLTSAPLNHPGLIGSPPNALAIF